MKLAKDWTNIWMEKHQEFVFLSTTEFEIEQAQDCLTRQIQLDAMKEGMKRAADIVNTTGATMDRRESTAWYVKTILSAAEQLTEKDLV